MTRITLKTLAESIDKLAISTGKGFKDMDEKFLAIDGKFDSLGKSINDRFWEMNNELHGLQNKVGNIENLYEKDREEHKIFRDKLGLLRKTA
jgi:archaellum component FlaC